MYFYQLIDELVELAVRVEQPGSEREQSDQEFISVRDYIRRHRPDVMAVWGFGEPPSESNAFRQGIFVGMADMLRLFSKHGLPEDLAEVLGTKVS